MPKKRLLRGFSLIELMVAITIIAIISSIGMVAFSSSQSTARDSRRKTDLEEIKKALYTMKTANGGKIVGTTGTDFLFWLGWSCYADDSGSCGPYSMNNKISGSIGGNLVEKGHLKTRLHDPKCPQTQSGSATCGTTWTDYYLQISSTDPDAFTLYARLETEPTIGSVVGCTPFGNYNYCITQ